MRGAALLRAASQTQPDHAAGLVRGNGLAFAQDFDAPGAGQAMGGQADRRQAAPPAIILRVAGQRPGRICRRNRTGGGGEKVQNGLLGGIIGRSCGKPYA